MLASVVPSLSVICPTISKVVPVHRNLLLPEPILILGVPLSNPINHPSVLLPYVDLVPLKMLPVVVIVTPVILSLTCRGVTPSRIPVTV